MKTTTVCAIPMGDAAGIGVEIILKSLVAPSLPIDASYIVIGDASVCKKVSEDLSLQWPFDATVEGEKDLFFHLQKGSVKLLLDQNTIDLSQFRYGEVSPQCGAAAYHALKQAASLCSKGVADVLVTPPLNKLSLAASSIQEIGNTELLATFTHSISPITMFETHNLKVFFLTRHLSLKEAIDAITVESLYEGIRECYTITQKSNFDQSLPFAIAALNPHSGEGGRFGDEESLYITPAVQRAQKEGMNVVGPISADSVFHLAHKNHYKAVLSLYHDQGHIATKTLDFDRTVSVTWNLPWIRTSVDHGTAFDIAGKNLASEISMLEAIKVAFRYNTKETDL
ncbi:MAG: 4-hydroxythreonine-4-phosphate dehydrogenase PdxA [Sphaerochaetaceae bacterium]|jgi:4-hydroxythreonine-4-phosphate dehydrogenase